MTTLVLFVLSLQFSTIFSSMPGGNMTQVVTQYTSDASTITSRKIEICQKICRAIEVVSYYNFERRQTILTAQEQEAMCRCYSNCFSWNVHSGELQELKGAIEVMEQNINNVDPEYFGYYWLANFALFKDLIAQLEQLIIQESSMYAYPH